MQMISGGALGVRCVSTSREYRLNAINFALVFLLSFAYLLHVLSMLRLASLSCLSGHLGDHNQLPHVLIHSFDLSSESQHLAVPLPDAFFTLP